MVNEDERGFFFGCCFQLNQGFTSEVLLRKYSQTCEENSEGAYEFLQYCSCIYCSVPKINLNLNLGK